MKKGGKFCGGLYLIQVAGQQMSNRGGEDGGQDEGGPHRVTVPDDQS